MNRWVPWTAATILCAAIAAPAVHADVKTRQKVTFNLEGFLGGVVRVFGGSAARDGVTSTVAVKGSRKLSMSDTTGQLVDLTEQKAYTLDPKKKEYRVVTFAEMRAAFEKAKADAEKQAQSMKPEEKEQVQQAGEQLEFTTDVKETGQKRSIAGYEAREVVLTVTGRAKGKTLEEGGGIVLTSDMWLGPKIAALDELYEFELKFVKAVYGEAFAADMQQMAGMIAMYPAFQTMAGRMEAEGRKVQGTSLSSTMTFESVRSAEQMKAATEAAPPPSGGLGDSFARRLMGNRAQPQQRTKIMTTAHDMVSVETSVSADDVAIPAGYKEKK